MNIIPNGDDLPPLRRHLRFVDKYPRDYQQLFNQLSSEAVLGQREVRSLTPLHLIWFDYFQSFLKESNVSPGYFIYPSSPKGFIAQYGDSECIVFPREYFWSGSRLFVLSISHRVRGGE